MSNAHMYVASVYGYKVCFLVFYFQYFLWYLTFLPLIIPRLSKLTMKEAVIVLIVWFGTQVGWQQ